MRLRPFWRYYGGKWAAARRYPAPRFDVIVEPFAGAAGYALNYADRDVILIERDPGIAAIWRYLIGADPDEILHCPDIPDGGTVDDLPGPDALRDLAGFWCNQGCAQPRRTPSKWVRTWTESGAGGNMAGWTQPVRERIASQIPRIRHWTLIQGGYEDAPDVEATWFVDPPYQTSAGRLYRYSEIDYQQLGAWCQARSGQIIACDQPGASWLPWTHSVQICRARHDLDPVTSEVYYHRGGAQLSLLGGAL